MVLMASNNKPFGDCLLISESGEKYWTYKGLLSKHSKVFKDMFDSCDPPASSADGEGGAIELKLTDASAHIEAATSYMNSSDAFWSTVKGNNPDELLGVLDGLIRFAHKYDMQGICNRVDDFLSREGAIINIINSGLLFAAWDLVSTFKLGKAQRVLESHLAENPTIFLNQIKAGIPPSCDHMRSMLTVGHAYASRLRKAKGRCTELHGLKQKAEDSCKEATQLKEKAEERCKELTALKEKEEARCKGVTESWIYWIIVCGIACAFLGSCVGICSQVPEEKVRGWVEGHIFGCFVVTQLVWGAHHMYTHTVWEDDKA